MLVHVYDSAYNSAEGDYCGRSIMWAISAETGKPVCINVVGHPSEAFLELPPVATNRAVKWDGTDAATNILRKRVLEVISISVGSDECGSVTMVQHYKYQGYSENKSWYVRLACEKRETLDRVIKDTKVGLSGLFSGQSPIWRETEIDPVTKMFITLKWNRSGWFRLPTEYQDVDLPPTDVTVIGVPRPLRWVDRTSAVREVTHVYVGVGSIEHIADPAEIIEQGARADPWILYFDFEAYRGKLEGFPSAAVPSDLIYMCSVVVARLGGPRAERRRYCICVGDPDRSLLDGVTVLAVGSEKELYWDLARIIREENPDVISGYNIHGFDLKYMEMRLALWGEELPDISRLPGKRSEFDLLRGPRGSRYANLKCPGRIVLDLFLYLIKNTSRQDLPSFDLKSVTQLYLGRKVEFVKRAHLHVELSIIGPTHALWTAVLTGSETSIFCGTTPLAPGEAAALRTAVESMTGLVHALDLQATEGIHLTVQAPGVLTADACAQIAGEVLEAKILKARRKRGSEDGDWTRPPEKDTTSTKIDLSYRDQFILYLRYILGFPDGPAGLGRIAEYCMRDSDVLPDLLENRAIWSTGIQFSNILGCTVQTVAVAGQVERLTPMLYSYVRNRDTVIEVNPDAGKFKFEGGYVHLSSPGRHTGVCIGDFASLYPSIIIWLNLCMTTRVHERDSGALMRRLRSDQYHVCNVLYKVLQEKQIKGSADDPDFTDDIGDDGALDTLIRNESDTDAGEIDWLEGGDSESDEYASDGPDSQDSPFPGVRAISIPSFTGRSQGPTSMVAGVNLTQEMKRKLQSSAIRKAKTMAMSAEDNYATRSENIMFVGADVRLGIVPEALVTLLGERKRIRTKVRPELLKKYKACLANKDAVGAQMYKQLADDADKRQLAMKEAANSLYGFHGATAPHADPFIAMVTTAEGRNVIKESTRLIIAGDPGARRHIYSDTDSSMISDRGFAKLPSRTLSAPPKMRLEDLGVVPEDLPTWCAEGYSELLSAWSVAQQELEWQCVIPVIEEACDRMCSIPDRAGIYKKPMKFEYEGFVLSGMWFAKKFYITRILTDDSEPDLLKRVKVKQRGILLRRGDYPEIIKKVYGDACFSLLDGKSVREALLAVVGGVRRILTGPELTFLECRISSDFKSLADYKEATCKMAVLARRAEAAGVPLQDNSRVDCVMLAPPPNATGERLARDSIILASGGNSDHLATRDMYALSGGTPDRDHYFKVLISHVDTLFDCAMKDHEGEVAYFLQAARAEQYADRSRPFEFWRPIRVTRQRCEHCRRLMTVMVGGTGEWSTRHEIAEYGIRISQRCLNRTCELARCADPRCKDRRCAECIRRSNDGSIPISAITLLAWNLTAPLASFKAAYRGILRSMPDADIRVARERACDFLSEIVNSLY
jgi:DNA polymerase elongation subunit (family B)